MRSCDHCGGEIERRFRYCPAGVGSTEPVHSGGAGSAGAGATLCASPQRRKIVEFFPAHPLLDEDSGKALRVSHYFGETPEECHVRFSVWDQSGRAHAAVSLDEETALQLATFLHHRRPTLIEQIRHLAHR